MIWRLMVVFLVSALAGAFTGEISYLVFRMITSLEFGMLLVVMGIAVLIALRIDRRDYEYLMDRADERRAAALLPPIPRQRAEEVVG